MIFSASGAAYGTAKVGPLGVGEGSSLAVMARIC